MLYFDRNLFDFIFYFVIKITKPNDVGYSNIEFFFIMSYTHAVSNYMAIKKKNDFLRKKLVHQITSSTFFH